ncbi:Protein of unknown function (DUF1353) [Rivularia sp. PCC 7116]|uniref:DUF1353 domain-containing protein n=1 Tax=Rivularia sp. PCC 7116 TaxID=373994 RepID=UPI00029F13A3|nr:DUF1353 domain-containing protein [Rivularia sp. PCC 7116]AFY56034.1 Protein of unknown function (DUF1353) [Rivularia sp. PCC 7116]
MVCNQELISKFPRAKVSYIPEEDAWTLEEEYCYEDKIKGTKIILHKGFSFDLSSIPRFLWIICGTHELSLEAPLIHDFMYMSKGGKKMYFNQKPILGNIETKEIFYSRKEADKLFRKMMQEAGVSKWRGLFGYMGVRLFGGMYWKPNQKVVDNLTMAVN